MLEPEPQRTLVISHWAKLIDGFQMAPSELYAAVEANVRSREVPGVNTSRVDWHEGGAFSDKREYLRLNRRDLDFRTSVNIGNHEWTSADVFLLMFLVRPLLDRKWIKIK